MKRRHLSRGKVDPPRSKRVPPICCGLPAQVQPAEVGSAVPSRRRRQDGGVRNARKDVPFFDHLELRIFFAGLFLAGFFPADFPPS
jgi:hypothetical protein